MLFKEDGESKDSKLMSGIIREQIQIGGAVVYAWLLEGTWDQSNSKGEVSTQLDEGLSSLGIQDVILGEDRDRKYSDEAVRLVGSYTVSQNELDFAKWGVMLTNDIIQMEFHKDETIDMCGRQLKIGDVVEMTHIRDLSQDGRPQNRFYEVRSITRSPSGYDYSYQNHVMAVTMQPIKDAQEFIDIMDRPGITGTVRDDISDRANREELTAKIQDIAYEQSYTTWFDTTRLYIDPDTQIPFTWGDDGLPPNGQPVEAVSSFPSSPTAGDYVLRVDFDPNRLYRYQAGKWLLKEVDRKREWNTYNWSETLREHMSDRSYKDDIRPWELRSVHDMLTPREERSQPSPPGDFHTPTPIPEVGSWDKPIIVVPSGYEEPASSDSAAPITEVTLVESATAAEVHSGLNITSGGFKAVLVQYTLERGTAQRVGEMIINDDGTNTSLMHEWDDLDGDVEVTFTVAHDSGERKLYYQTTGSAGISVFRFRIRDTW